jgi:hypothetical protein
VAFPELKFTFEPIVNGLGTAVDVGLAHATDKVSPCDCNTCPDVPGSRSLPNLNSPSKFISVKFPVLSPVKLILLLYYIIYIIK